MKKLIIVLLCILLLGCAITPTQNETTEVPGEQVINCPDCDDGDKCTTDICAGEEKKCIHVPIKKCCGDGECEDGETCLSCEEDCGKCYSLQQLQKDTYKIYGRKIILTKNRVIGKANGEVLSDDYDFYDSAYITAIEIKDKENFLLSFEDFKNFTEGIANARFDAFLSKITKDYPKEDYVFTANYTTEVTGAAFGDMIEYNYWAKTYKIFRSCAICNIRNESYETIRLADPVLDSMVYLRCTPSLVIGVYSNQPQMLEKFWTNLNEEEYDAQMTTWMRIRVRGAFDEATLLLELCSENK